MRRAVLVCAAWLAAVPAPAQPAPTPQPAGVPPDTYAQQLSVRLYGAAAQPDLYAARVAIHDENPAVRGAGWTGSISESSLRHALGGGLEVSYGFLDDVKFLFDLGGFGSAAEGTFTGYGANSVVDPVLGRLSQRLHRVNRYPVFAQTLGATLLLRSFEWCRFGLTLRVGVCELAGATERAESSGPLGTSWTSRKLTGTAPAAFVGFEWEWLSTAAALGLPMAGYAMLGYRQLQFTSVTAGTTDSTGLSLTGDYLNDDGTRRTLDLSGPEVRIGVQFAISYALTP
ncbi:MAG: hypothetical protein AAB152_05330 [Candidatus Coatesbacteria bacterium]